MKLLNRDFIKDHSFAILIVAAIIARIIVFAYWIQQDIPEASDYKKYVDLAEHIKDSNILEYEGLRTPGYPFIILLGGFNKTAIVIIQMLMGIGISSFLYFITKRLTNNKIFALISGLSYAIYLPFFRYEFWHLTETTSIFSTTIILFLVLISIHNKNHSKYITYWLLLAGLFSTLLILTKPESFVLIGIVGGYIFLGSLFIEKTNFILLTKRLLVFFTPVIISFGIWLNIMYQISGNYQISILGGLIDFQKACAVSYDQIPSYSKEYPEYAKLYQLYNNKRNEYIKSNHYLPYVIWNQSLQTEMKKETNLSLAEISEILGQIGNDVMQNNKGDFLKTTIPFFVNIWRLPAQSLEGTNKIISFFNKYIISVLYHLILTFVVIYFVINNLRVVFWKKIFVDKNSELLFINVVFFSALFTAAFVSYLTIGREGPRRNIFIEPMLISTAFYIYEINKNWFINTYKSLNGYFITNK